MNVLQAKTDYSIDLKNPFGYVYVLTFPNGKKYVGQTIKPWKRRLSQHKCSKSCCRALHAAMNKYGLQNIDQCVKSVFVNVPHLNGFAHVLLNTATTGMESQQKSINQRCSCS